MKNVAGSRSRFSLGDVVKISDSSPYFEPGYDETEYIIVDARLAPDCITITYCIGMIDNRRGARWTDLSDGWTETDLTPA